MTCKNVKNHNMPKMLFVVGIVISIIIGALYIYVTWSEYTSRAKDAAIGLAVSAAAFIEPDHVEALEMSSADITASEYVMLKEDLTEFKKRNPEMRFAYLTALEAGKIYIMVDSEPPESDNYSPPGQEYPEASEQFKLVFSSGEAVLTKPVTDRWGTWVSALAPIKDTETGVAIAILGIDYPADYWKAETTKNVIHAVIMVSCILLLLIALFLVYSNNYKIRTLNRKLSESESLFKAVFEQAPVGISIVNNQKFLSETNAEFLRILGSQKDEITSLNWADITHPDDLKEDLDLFARFKAGDIPGYSMDKRYIKPDGSDIWVHMVVSGIRVETGGRTDWNHICIVQDINDKKTAGDALRESERSKGMLLSNLPGMAYRCKYDKNWTMEFLSEGCFALTGYKSESLLNNNKLSYNELITPEFRKYLWDEWTRILKLRIPFRAEYEITTAEGERKWVLETGQGVYRADNSVEALEGIIIDITEAKKTLDQIKYINDHDYMTGLYNRKYYEEEKNRLEEEGKIPISILMADINGVRLINDAFGHAEGDRLIIEAARIIKSCCRENDLIAKTGGDDFTVILPETGREKAGQIMEAIKEACEEYNRTISNSERYLNLSIGFGTKESEEDSLDKAGKDAEDYLHKRKLFEQKSYHNALLSSIMATMYARSQETEEHSQRISKLCGLIAQRLNLPQKALDELNLFSMLHDIGKVGISDRILNKPGALNDEERCAMKAHPEIGYRIAMSAPELASIAEYILTHHERWDGTGYPYGKKGEEIPLLSRILAVADAFDAMTADRIYRTAISKEEALKEIINNAGTQFDPSIAQIFAELIEQSDESL